jgi:hypothetical protein
VAFLTEEDEIPRILTRGTTQKFRIGFFTDSSKATPLIPKDPLVYPSYEIVDNNGVTVQNGVLQADSGPGIYSASWSVSQDASLSTPNSRYEFKAFIITNTNEQAEVTHQFDVQDVVITATEDRSQCILTLAERELRLMIQRTSRIDLDNFGSLTLQVMRTNTASNNFLDIGPGGLTNIVSLTNDQIQEVPSGDSFVYYYDIPSETFTNNTAYVSLWTIRENIAGSSLISFKSRGAGCKHTKIPI